MTAALHAHHAPSALDSGVVAEQFLTFEIRDELFALPILAIQEIRGWEKASQIPQAGPHMVGVINLRGSVVPVLDVRTRLGIAPREVTLTTVLIVVRVESLDGGSVAVGCVVDAVSDVVSIRPDQIRDAPDACGRVNSHFIRGVATVENRLVLVLDLALLVTRS